MIARLSLTPTGPALVRSAPRVGPRRGIVIVARELYCECEPDEWPAAGSDAPILRARLHGRTWTGSRAMLAATRAGGAGRNPMLVPEEALRETARHRARTIRLRLAAFTATPLVRHGTGTGTRAPAWLLAASVSVFAVSFFVARSARSSLADAHAERDGLVALERELAELDAERSALALALAAAVRPTVLPGRLTGALVAALEPGEHVRSVSLDGTRLAMVVSSKRAIGLAERIGEVAGVRGVASELRHDDGSPVVTIGAEIDREGAAR